MKKIRNYDFLTTKGEPIQLSDDEGYCSACRGGDIVSLTILETDIMRIGLCATCCSHLWRHLKLKEDGY